MSAQVGVPSADWQRLHPISPFLRGGVMVLALGGYVISQQFERIVGISWGPDVSEDVPFGQLWLALSAFLALVAVVVLYGWLAWRVSKFLLGETTLEFRTGLVFKQHRQVRYDRIQSVDISRPLLARLFGLAQVVVQSAGGSDSHVQLAYLGHARALTVRDQVLSLIDAEEDHAVLDGEVAGGDPSVAGGLAAGQSAEGRVDLRGQATARVQDIVRGGAAPTRGRQVLRTIALPMPRLIGSVVYHPSTILAAIAVPGVLIGAIFESFAVLPILVPVFFGLVLPQVRRFLTDANFSVDIERDRLRITHGLTDQRSNTVPLARIQAVEISQGYFWRLPQWWRVKVTIAGVAGEQSESQTTAFPVAVEAEVLDLVTVMLPEVAHPVVLAGMYGKGAEPGFVTSSPRSAIFQPWSWRRNGYAATPAVLLIRRGRLARVVSLIPHARVQSLQLMQGPLDRRRHISSVHADVTAGPVSGVIAHLDVDEAHRLLAEQSSRSASARTRLRGRLPLVSTTSAAGAGAQPGSARKDLHDSEHATP